MFTSQQNEASQMAGILSKDAEKPNFCVITSCILYITTSLFNSLYF